MVGAELVMGKLGPTYLSLPWLASATFLGSKSGCVGHKVVMAFLTIFSGPTFKRQYCSKITLIIASFKPCVAHLGPKGVSIDTNCKQSQIRHSFEASAIFTASNYGFITLRTYEARDPFAAVFKAASLLILTSFPPSTISCFKHA